MAAALVALGVPPCSAPGWAHAQATLAPSSPAGPHGAEPPDVEEPASRVEVEPLARDDQIGARLREILSATEWFSQPAVRVRDGVVFLDGEAQTADHKKWAGDLARSTRDVAAVVNRMRVREPPLWDFRPAVASLRDLWRGVLRGLPLVAFSTVILALTSLAAWLTAWLSRRLLGQRELSGFLREVIARAAALLVFIAGLYVVLRVAGLTTIAMTVMGGTGLVGLVLGIAFRGISENFLASVFLSLQQPFRAGDLIRVSDFLGYVQRLTNRATVLMTLDGHHVQIPNSIVYQSAIRNYTSNPNRREEIRIGIGYADSIPLAQKVALEVLSEHPAVLREPEPWVLVDALEASTVALRVYFWLDGSRHSWLKVRSSVSRLIKHAFQAQNISMPADARELTFSRAVPVRLMEPTPGAAEPRPRARDAHPTSQVEGDDTPSAEAEGGLHSEATALAEQARHARTPDEGEDLLRPTAPSSAPRR